MYQEDYLLRMIRRLVAAISRLREDPDDPEAQEGVSGELHRIFGMSRSTLDALPASALIATLRAGDTLAAERLGALATALEALAELEGGPQAQSRARKAAQIRAAIGALEPG